MRKILFDFCRKVWSEQTWGAIAITSLSGIAVLCIFGKLSLSNPTFSLPQPQLGYGLLGLVVILVFFAVMAFYSAHRDTPVPVESGQTKFTGFTEAEIDKLIRIQISGEGEGMCFYKNGEDGNLTAWLDIVNFARFPITIDRILGDVIVNNAAVAQLQHMKKERVEPTSATHMHVQARLTPEDIKKICFQINVRGEVDSVGFRFVVYADSEAGSVALNRSPTIRGFRFLNFGKINLGS